MFCLVLLLPALLGAVPVIDRPVTDPLEVLTAEQQRTVARELEALRAATGVQMAVLVVGTTWGEPIEDYSLRVAQAWKGGRKGEDKGLLFVLAVKDRRMRLDVGYGLEAHLPDGVVKGMLDGLRPFMREQDYTGALVRLIQGVGERLPTTGNAPALRVVKSEEEVTHDALVRLLVLAWCGFGVLSWLRRPTKRPESNARVRVSAQWAVSALVLGAVVWTLRSENLSRGTLLFCAGLLGVELFGSRILLLASAKTASFGAACLLALLAVSWLLIIADDISLFMTVVKAFWLPLLLSFLLCVFSQLGPARWLGAGFIWWVGGMEFFKQWRATPSLFKDFFDFTPSPPSRRRASRASWTATRGSGVSSASSSSDSSWSSSSSSDSSSSSSFDSGSSSSSSSSSSDWSGGGGGFGGGGASSDW